LPPNPAFGMFDLQGWIPFPTGTDQDYTPPCKYDKVDTVVTKFAGKDNNKLSNYGCTGTFIVIYWSKEKADKIYSEACLT